MRTKTAVLLYRLYLIFICLAVIGSALYRIIYYT